MQVRKMGLFFVAALVGGLSACSSESQESQSAALTPNTIVIRNVGGQRIVSRYYASPARRQLELQNKIAYQTAVKNGTALPAPLPTIPAETAVVTTSGGNASDSSSTLVTQNGEGSANCLGSDMWLYNTANEAEDDVTEIMVCVSGEGSIPLADVTYTYCGYTAPPYPHYTCLLESNFGYGRLQSYASGSEYGYFVGTDGNPSFGTYQAANVPTDGYLTDLYLTD